MENEINNVEILKLFRQTEGKNGPYITKKGNKFTKVDIHIDPRTIQDPEFEGKMSYFDFFDNTTNWDIGTVISGKIVKNGKYFNFELPVGGKKAIELDIKQLENRIKKLEEVVFPQPDNERDYRKKSEPNPPAEVTEEESDDLPF
jgi:hypothetical protein